MLVFWEQKLVFLATPKAGSTAVERALESLAEVAIARPPALKHTPIYRYRRFFQPWLEKSAQAEFTAVALMREPVSWLGSWYRFRQREDVMHPANSTRGMSFDDFVLAYLKKPRPGFANVGSQAKFLLGPDGRGVEHIFPYEEMGAFLAFLEERLGCEIVLPRVNVSPPAETALSAGVEARLRAECAEDFELYARVRADAAGEG
ncbi:sulfotransferase family 2 domain-containing protein [Solirhodobacter olei]|uniref:sulfotransferase family 2 domain-containing protein n=1 Tax=Solirhodobacter olei TaxID=2493082 RepID=UPI000FD96475|nr:sulfotransferase family 2 domain-containing protein [Solirhodobacter olei]